MNMLQPKQGFTPAKPYTFYVLSWSHMFMSALFIFVIIVCTQRHAIREYVIIYFRRI